MKVKIYLVLSVMLISINLCLGQSAVRENGEKKEHLVSKFIAANAISVGEIYEFQESNTSVLIYFEIQATDTASIKETSANRSVLLHDISPFYGRATLTLFNELVSVDGNTYTKYIVDTLNTNSGCCPCHQPARADSIAFINQSAGKQMKVYITHPVRPDCNSMTSNSALYYDRVETQSLEKLYLPKPIPYYKRTASSKKRNQ